MIATKNRANVSDVSKFLEIGKFIYSKKSVSVFSTVEKRAGRLTVCNGKEWLLSIIEDPAIDGLYTAESSQALGRLYDYQGIRNFPSLAFNPAEISNSVALAEKQAADILRAAVSVSTDETRYFMNGVYFSDGNVISTDGRRMYIAPGFDNFPNVILPITKALAFILKNAEYIEYGIYKRAPEIINNVEHFYPKTYSIFNFLYKECEFYYCVDNIEGQFPNYKRVIPEGQPHEMSAPDLAEWEKIHKIAKALVSKKSNRIIFDASAAPAGIVDVFIDNTADSIGTIKWPGFTDKVSGGIGKLAINYKYLDDALSVQKIEKIRFSDDTHALRFDYCDGSMSIVMPMSID